jgi:FkbM family methyltransferase
MKIRGIEIELHSNEDLSNHIRRERDFFEAEILDYLARYHNSHRTILDIGACFGNHSLYFTHFLKYESLVAFEPIPANYLLLVKNLTGHNNIRLFNCAVSSVSKQNFKMVEKLDNMGASYHHPDGRVSVESVTIDSLGFIDVTLMKIDVEEHEREVLQGATDTIIRCQPLILIEDWHREYHTILEPLGYEVKMPWEEHQTFLWGPK